MKQSVLYAAALLTTIGLAGCGSASSSGSTAFAASASAPVAGATTTAATTAPVTVGDTVDFAVVSKAVAAASTSKGTVHVTSSVAGMGAVQIDLDLHAQSVRESVDVAGMSVEVLVVDEQAYLGGGVAKTLGAKTRWLKIDPRGTDKLSKQLGPLVTSLQSSSASSDPATGLSSLTDAKAKVTAASATSTTYTVDLSAAQLAELAKKQPSLAKAGGQAVTFDYTIDSQGLPQKMALTIAGKSIVTTYSGWGAPVTITAPAASDVTLTSDLAAAA